MENIIIDGKETYINISPLGLVVYAENFLSAYKSFEPDVPFSPPKYYLVCHSLELALKSYLLMETKSMEELKKLGHGLGKILGKSREFGLDSVVVMSELENCAIDKANKWYKRKGFEYFSIQNLYKENGRSSLPDLEVLFVMTERIINILKPYALR